MGINFKNWREHIMIVLGCMDLDLAIQIEPLATLIDSNTTKERAYYEKWERSNRVILMIMKRVILEIMRSSIPKEDNAQKYLTQVANHFAKTKKLKQVPFLVTLFQSGIRAKRT